jgi:Tfp pilus assembly protein PilN
MPQINLAPESQYLLAARRRHRRAYIIASVIVLLAVVAWGSAYAFERRAAGNLDEARQELARIQTEISRLGDASKRVSAFEQRSAALGSLLESHLSWAPLLSELERLLPPSTVLSRFSAKSTSSVVEFSGRAPSLDSVAQAIASLTTRPDRQTMFTRGSVAAARQAGSTGADGQPVESHFDFSGSLEFQPDSLRLGSVNN